MPDVILIVVNAIVTVLASFFTIKFTLSGELKKMKYQHNRDDDLAIKDAYSEMRSAISHFLTCPTGNFQYSSQTALSKFIALAPQKIQPLLQDMHSQLLEREANRTKIKELLGQIDVAWQSYFVTRTSKR